MNKSIINNNILFKKHEEEIYDLIQSWHCGYIRKLLEREGNIMSDPSHNNSWYNYTFRKNYPVLAESIPEKNYSIICTVFIAFQQYLSIWYKHINDVLETDNHKLYVIMVLNNIIGQLLNLEKHGLYNLCGCTDYKKAYIEDRTWNYANEIGQPGHFIKQIDNQYVVKNGVLVPIEIPTYQWVSDNISFKKFTEREVKEQSKWRHDIRKLRINLSDYLKYFINNPHKNYRKVFFPLASTVGQECAKKILAFL
jgi:hypothetical protein